jgi:hypothetical protein
VVKDLELHTGIYDMVPVYEGWSRFNLVEEVWMIADLLQLHQHIEELDPVLGAHAVHCGDVARDDLFVELLLKLGQTNKHVDLLLCGEVVFDVHLETTQHERFE